MKHRYHIGIFSDNDWNYTIKELTDEEYELLHDIALELETTLANIAIEKIPSRQELIEDYEKFAKDPKYASGWALWEIIETYVNLHHVHKGCAVKNYLINELQTYVIK